VILSRQKPADCEYCKKDMFELERVARNYAMKAYEPYADKIKLVDKHWESFVIPAKLALEVVSGPSHFHFQKLDEPDERDQKTPYFEPSEQFKHLFTADGKVKKS